MKIIDNFVPKEEFKAIQDLMMGDAFPWYYNDYIIEPSEKENLNDYQFTHQFFKPPYGTVSNYIEIFSSSIEKLKVKLLVRIKANMSPRTSKPVYGGYHSDVDLKCKTAILYINTNNGFTQFKDGNKVESLANRMVIFDSKDRHSGVTCTDQKRRVVVNFNYFELLSGQKHTPEYKGFKN